MTPNHHQEACNHSSAAIHSHHLRHLRPANNEQVRVNIPSRPVYLQPRDAVALGFVSTPHDE